MGRPNIKLFLSLDSKQTKVFIKLKLVYCDQFNSLAFLFLSVSSVSTSAKENKLISIIRKRLL